MPPGVLTLALCDQASRGRTPPLGSWGAPRRPLGPGGGVGDPGCSRCGGPGAVRARLASGPAAQQRRRHWGGGRLGATGRLGLRVLLAADSPPGAACICQPSAAEDLLALSC